MTEGWGDRTCDTSAIPTAGESRPVGSRQGPIEYVDDWKPRHARGAVSSVIQSFPSPQQRFICRKMDKQTLVQKPFTSQGRQELKEGRHLNVEQVDQVEKKTLGEKDAWDKLGYS